MHSQEMAWDSGDLDGFMAAYHPDVCFVSVRGTTCGRDEVTGNYRRSYPDQGAMGDLAFRIGEVLPIADGHAWCTGDWTLHRSNDTLSGGFTLLWRWEGKWLIVRDHTY
ncbi:MAG: nuclear transport factor 2 family protein [Flavobacteriales bacterium]|nr:nuclear transport factor 2 family protein [Flavobacteriales bacterium]